MNIKKIATTVAAVSLFAASAIPAFAYGGEYSRHSDDDLSIRSYARVSNDVYTIANTGINRISGYKVYGGDINTGDADALADLRTSANYTEVEDCGCFDDVRITSAARVSNDVYTIANTGGNTIRGARVYGGDIDTGDAIATSVVTNDVNTTIVGD